VEKKKREEGTSSLAPSEEQATNFTHTATKEHEMRTGEKRKVVLEKGRMGARSRALPSIWERLLEPSKKMRKGKGGYVSSPSKKRMPLEREKFGGRKEKKKREENHFQPTPKKRDARAFAENGGAGAGSP